MAEIRIPKVGMSAVDVEVIEIFVKPGDRIAIGDAIMEVGADKVDIGIESEIAGIVDEVRVSVGDVADVGQVVVIVRDE